MEDAPFQPGDSLLQEMRTLESGAHARNTGIETVPFGGNDVSVARLSLDSNISLEEKTLDKEQNVASEKKSAEEGDVAAMATDQGQTPVPEDAILAWDVLFDDKLGSNSPHTSHGGNKRYQALVFAYANEFASTNGDKMEVVSKILDTFHAKNGRFLKQDGESWLEVSDETAIGKIRSALRDESKTAKTTGTVDGKPGAKGIPEGAITVLDVLCCDKSGANIYSYDCHEGNQKYRDLIRGHASEFASTEGHKVDVARKVVSAVHAKDGRFLKKDKGSGTWFEIGDKKAANKALRALCKASKSVQRNTNSSPVSTAANTEDQEVKIMENVPCQPGDSVLQELQTQESGTGIETARLPVENNISLEEKTLDKEQNVASEMMNAEEEGNDIAMENDRAQTPVPDEAITNADDLYGSIYICQEGNQIYHNLVHAGFKKGVAKKILDTVYDRKHGRFMTKDDGSGPCVEVSDKTAKDKATHALNKMNNTVQSTEDNMCGAQGIPDDAITDADVLGLSRTSSNIYKSYEGNKKYRDLISAHAIDYALMPKGCKMYVARKVVSAVHAKHGRFLIRDDRSGTWFQICEEKATDKVYRALYKASSNIQFSANLSTAEDGARGGQGIPDDAITREDVLCDKRGKTTYKSHKGNEKFQAFILSYVNEFVSTKGVKMEPHRSCVTGNSTLQTPDESRVDPLAAPYIVQETSKTPSNEKRGMKGKSDTAVDKIARGREQKHACVTGDGSKPKESGENPFGPTSPLMDQQSCEASSSNGELGIKRKRDSLDKVPPTKKPQPGDTTLQTPNESVSDLKRPSISEEHGLKRRAAEQSTTRQRPVFESGPLGPTPPRVAKRIGSDGTVTHHSSTFGDVACTDTINEHWCQENGQALQDSSHSGNEDDMGISGVYPDGIISSSGDVADTDTVDDNEGWFQENGHTFQENSHSDNERMNEVYPDGVVGSCEEVATGAADTEPKYKFLEIFF